MKSLRISYAEQERRAALIAKVQRLLDEIAAELRLREKLRRARFGHDARKGVD